MPNLVDLVKQRTIKATGMSNRALIRLIHEDESCLHDPFLYDGMDVFVKKLHDFKLKQEHDPHQLLIIDTDYDTDGSMAATIMSAGLNVLGFNYRVYIPTMSDGYGLSPAAVKKMYHNFETPTDHLAMIVTADNGTNAIAGVEYAQKCGLEVLVTDHHLTTNENAPASVIINPNKTIPGGEPYPFKGNAGGAVIWKCLLAYAQTYDPGKYDLIYDLIVFAGIADVADVMPITDENHFMVKQAVKEIKRLFRIRQAFGNRHNVYGNVKSTDYMHYNAAFWGLYDLINGLQNAKDEQRRLQNKRPYPLPQDEELISWYLAPMLNAPRRVHDTCREAMLALMSTSTNVRHYNVQKLIALNAEKTAERDRVLKDVDFPVLKTYDGSTLFINAKHGISGLVAGQVAEKTGSASIVFALPTDSDKNIYDYHEFDDQPEMVNNLIIGASARSNSVQPLDEIVRMINQIHPGLVVSGGGHALAAGYRIHYRDLPLFAQLFNSVAKLTEENHIKDYEAALDRGEALQVYANQIKLSFHQAPDTVDFAVYNLTGKEQSFKRDLMHVLDLESALKPFGHDFNAQTQFLFDLEPMTITGGGFSYNPHFWKTFKFNLYGVDVLTFDQDLAKLVKDRIEIGNNAIITLRAKLTLNQFRGNITPQLQLEQL